MRSLFCAALALFTCLWSVVTVADQRVYRVDPEQSLILIHVERGGLAGMFGHEHAVASQSLQGEIVVDDDPTNSRATLVIPFKDLIVDKPSHREAIGLKRDVSEESITGTSENMHQHVLETDVHPQADVVVSVKSWEADEARLQVQVSFRGVSHSYEVPATLSVDDAVLRVSGDMTLQHRDFGMKPFRAAGGLLRVGKKLKLRFSIVARK